MKLVSSTPCVEFWLPSREEQSLPGRADEEHQVPLPVRLVGDVGKAATVGWENMEGRVAVPCSSQIQRPENG